VCVSMYWSHPKGINADNGARGTNDSGCSPVCNMVGCTEDRGVARAYLDVRLRGPRSESCKGGG